MKRNFILALALTVMVLWMFPVQISAVESPVFAIAFSHRSQAFPESTPSPDISTPVLLPAYSLPTYQPVSNGYQVVRFCSRPGNMKVPHQGWRVRPNKTGFL